MDNENLYLFKIYLKIYFYLKSYQAQKPKIHYIE